MKFILFIILLFSCANVFSKEILCVPDTATAPFDSVELTRIKSNKYSVVVKQDGKILLNNELKYVF